MLLLTHDDDDDCNVSQVDSVSIAIRYGTWPEEVHLQLINKLKIITLTNNIDRWFR